MGLLDLFTNNGVDATGVDLLVRLSRECGWAPDLRHGNAIAHYFNGDAITPRRDVIIVHRPGDPVVGFSCSCRAAFTARAMTAPQLALFLARNAESAYGKWQISVEDGVVRASVYYMALPGGLGAAAFKTICSALVNEVAYVEEALHSQGML